VTTAVDWIRFAETVVHATLENVVHESELHETSESCAVAVAFSGIKFVPETVTDAPPLDITFLATLDTLGASTENSLNEVPAIAPTVTPIESIAELPTPKKHCSVVDEIQEKVAQCVMPNCAELV